MTQHYNPQAAVNVGGIPLHALLVPIPVVCFVGTLVTDIVYWRTAAMAWANMSAWLLLVGLIVSVLAVPAGLIDLLKDSRVRQLRAARIHALGNTLVLALAIFNEMIHTRDAYTSVMPAGLALSALTVLILLVTGWNGWSLVHRHSVGVRQLEVP